jgi:hypothetical protein
VDVVGSRAVERRLTFTPAGSKDSTAAVGVPAMELDEVIAPAADVEWVRQVGAAPQAMVGVVAAHELLTSPRARGNLIRDQTTGSMIRSSEIVDP